MGWKHKAYHIINSDRGQTRSKQQMDKTLKINFVSLSKSTDEKEKEGKNNNKGNCKALCVTRKRNKQISLIEVCKKTNTYAPPILNNLMFGKTFIILIFFTKRHYSLEIYRITASNLKMSFFPENVWMADFLEPLYFLFWIIALLFECLNTGISKFAAPTPSFLGLHSFLQRISTSGIKLRTSF